MSPGAKSSVYQFSAAQDTVLNSYIPLLEAAVARLNPKRETLKTCKDLSKWIQDTVNEIMDLPEFASLASLDDPIALKSWRQAVSRKYTNYFNNTLIRRWKASHATASSASSSSTSDSKTTDKMATTVFRALTVTGNLKGRQLFKEEMAEGIQAKVNELERDLPHLKGGALHNKALASMWEEANQEIWEEKAKEISLDIYENQQDFPYLMVDALQGLCNRGIVGPCVLQLSYGFRDKNDGLVCGTVYAGRDDISPVDDEDEWKIRWKDYVEAALPRQEVVDPTVVLPKTEAGLPLFPQIDERKTPLERLVDILEEYLCASWVFCQPNREKSPLDWPALLKSPNDFFDVKTFDPPFALTSPRDLAPAAVFGLVDYFAKSARSSEPFHFRLRPSDLPVTTTPSPPGDPVAPSSSSKATLAPASIPTPQAPPTSSSNQSEVPPVPLHPSPPTSVIASGPSSSHADSTPPVVTSPTTEDSSVVIGTHVHQSPGRQVTPSKVAEALSSIPISELPTETMTTTAAAHKKVPQSKKGKGRQQVSKRAPGKLPASKKTGAEPVLAATIELDQEDTVRRGGRKRKAPEPIVATASAARPVKRVRPSFEYETVRVDADGHPLDENGIPRKFF